MIFYSFGQQLAEIIKSDCKISIKCYSEKFSYTAKLYSKIEININKRYLKKINFLIIEGKKKNLHNDLIYLTYYYTIV